MKIFCKIYNVLFKKGWNTALEAHGATPPASCHDAGESPGLVFSIQNSLASIQRLVSFGTFHSKLLGSSAGSMGTQWVRSGPRVGTYMCLHVRLGFCLAAQEPSACLINTNAI